MLLDQKDASPVPLKKVLPISDLMGNGMFASVMKIHFICPKKKSWISQNILSLHTLTSEDAKRQEAKMRRV